MLVCEREAILPTLAVRKACVEDHDDLAPLMAAQASSLERTYGAFYLAELIEGADGVDTHVLVAEVAGKVVSGGFQVDYSREFVRIEFWDTWENIANVCRLLPRNEASFWVEKSRLIEYLMSMLVNVF